MCILTNFKSKLDGIELPCTIRTLLPYSKSDLIVLEIQTQIKHDSSLNFR